MQKVKQIHSIESVGNEFSTEPISAEALLSRLRQAFDLPGLDFAVPPHRIGEGGEAIVDALQLRGAGDALSGPLVLRRHTSVSRADPVREAALHEALAIEGFPVPRILLAEPDPELLGAPFSLMQRVPGRALLEDVARPGELLRRPFRLPLLVYDAAVRVPRLLADTQRWLHSLNAERVMQEVRRAGVAERRLAFDGRLDELGDRIRGAGLAGLGPGLAWLERHRPADRERVVCHGDFVFTNLYVEEGRLTGVFDWSNAAIAPPAYDVAGTLARLTSTVPDLPPLLRGLFGRVQRHLARSYLRTYSQGGSVDGDALGYFDAYWTLAELTGSGERLREGSRFTGRIEERWLLPEAIDAGARRFHQRTGVQVEPSQPVAP